MSEKQTDPLLPPVPQDGVGVAGGSRISTLSLIVVPLLLFVTIGWFAPNFVATGDVRHDPLGGDFLQEYAGGALFLDSRHNNQLYNVDVVRVIQHDAGRLNFSWDENRFFPMVYPPFYYAAVSPFSQLDYHVAARCWLGLMTVFLILALWLIQRGTRLPTGLLLLACGTAPLLLGLTTGQKGTLLLLILTACWFLLRKQKTFAAGAVFGLIAFKPHLAIPIGLFMLCRREWSFVMGCYFTVLLLIVASLLTGFDVCSDFYSVVMGFSDYVQSEGYHLEKGFSLWSAWQMMVVDATVAKIATVISSLLVLGATVWCLRQPALFRADALDSGFSVMVMATVLLSPHLYGYDLTMLVLPALLLTHQAMNRPPHWTRFAPAMALAIVLFCMEPLSQVAAATGIQPGVWLIVFAMVVVMRNRIMETSSVTERLAIGSQVG